MRAILPLAFLEANVRKFYEKMYNIRADHLDFVAYVVCNGRGQLKNTSTSDILIRKNFTNTNLKALPAEKVRQILSIDNIFSNDPTFLPAKLHRLERY